MRRARAVGFAASLYNMMRNNAAAVGIAYLTNKLVSLEQVHQAYLVSHFSVFDAWRLSNVAPLEPGSMAFNYLPQFGHRAEARPRDGLRHDSGAGRDAQFQRYLLHGRRSHLLPDSELSSTWLTQGRQSEFRRKPQR
jgi:hypothetical protein